MEDALIAEAGARSIELLRRNLTPEGIIAATAGERSAARHYTRVFGRDAAICALGMALSDDAALQAGAARGLLTLARYQAENGQIPKYVDTERGEGDFWYVGCIDATLWWLVAVDFLDKRGLGPREGVKREVEKALVWLSCQEHPRLFLLQQNEASDWADIMPRSGFVLYSNALWYYVKRLYALPHAEETRFHFNHLFFPFSREIPDYRRLRLLTHYVRKGNRGDELYLSFVNFSTWGEEGDVFGNLLAVLLGLAGDGPANRIYQRLRRAEVESPFPVRAVCTPITTDSLQWREYMGRHRQNLAFRYHNGGAWPFLGGFWVMMLGALGHKREARQALLRLAEANRCNGWEFNEWFDGRSGEPGGMAGQSWNAAMFLLARRGVEQKIF